MEQTELRDLPAAEPVYSLAQLAARSRSAQRRAAAMVSEWDTVAGLRIRALTPRSYSRLLVCGSPFLRPDSAIGRADVRAYAWAHHPLFTDDPLAADKAKREVFAQLDRNLMPPWLRWRYSRATLHDLTAAAYALTASEIRELMEVAFCDAPPSRGEDGRSPVASLEAQFIDLFAERYRQWPLETPIRDTPIRMLYQLMRCQQGTDYDADEAAVIAADLAALNAKKS